MIPRSISVDIPNFSSTTGDKIGAIKAIRALTGFGLKEAKDISDIPGRAELKIVIAPKFDSVQNRQVSAQENYEQQIYALRGAGVTVIERKACDDLLEDLRKIACTAVLKGHNDLAQQLIEVLKDYD